MTENLQPYIALRELITDPNKIELFGPGGLFGTFREDHTVLEIFAQFVNECKQKYHHIPNTINSETFIEYLTGEPSLDEERKKKITEQIQSLHRRGIIQDEPLSKNTLYNFAIIISDIGIDEKKELIIAKYDSALEKVLSLKDHEKAEMEPKKEAKAETVPEITDFPEQTEVVTPGPMAGAEKEGISVSSFTETTDEGTLGVKAEEMVSPQVYATKPKEQVISTAETPEMPEAIRIPMEEATTGVPTTVTIPGTPEKLTSEFTPTAIPASISAPIPPKTPETSISTVLPTPAFKPTSTSTSPTPTKGVKPRIIQAGEGLRRPEKLPQAPKQDSDQKTQTNTQPDKPPLPPRRQDAEKSPAVAEGKKKPSFAKKLARLASASVAAGTILPLFFS